MNFLRQARNQEFFRARELFWNQGVLVNIHLQHEKKGPAEKKYPFFCLETLKSLILNEKFYPQMTTVRAFFLYIRAFFPISKKSRGDLLPSPSIYTPVRVTLSFQVQQFGTGTRYGLEIVHQFAKRVKTKSQKISGANSYVCRSYRGNPLS